jgi:hypothetical protein
MRKLLLSLAAALTILSAGSLMSNRAEAMTLGTPAGVRAAIDEASVVDKVQCRMVWRCGYWGCGWRRACFGWPGYGRPWGWRRPWRRW